MANTTVVKHGPGRPRKVQAEPKKAPKVKIVDDAYKDKSAELVKRFVAYMAENGTKNIHCCFKSKKADEYELRGEGWKPAIMGEEGAARQLTHKTDPLWYIDNDVIQPAIEGPAEFARQQLADSMEGKDRDVIDKEGNRHSLVQLETDE